MQRNIAFTATRYFKIFPGILAAGSIAFLSGCSTAQYDMTQQKTANLESITPTGKVDVDSGGVISTVTYTTKKTGTWVKFNNDCQITRTFIGSAVMAQASFLSGQYLPSSGVVTYKGKKYHVVYMTIQKLETTPNSTYWATADSDFLVNSSGNISSIYLSGLIPGIDSSHSDCTVTLLKNYTHVTNNKVSVYYMGRTNSGFLKIGIKRPKDFQDKSQQSINIPAQPGLYSISSCLPGYSVRVYDTSHFRADLQLVNGASVD